MHKISVIIAFVIVSINCFAQKFEWLTTSQSNANWMTHNPLVETDVQGNLLSLTYHQMSGAIIIVGNDTVQPPCCNYTFVLTKMDSAGAVLWTKWFQIGNGGFWDMCTDANGYIYVAANMNTINTYEDADTSFIAGSGEWVISFDSSGTFRWILGGFTGGNRMMLASTLSSSGFYLTSQYSIYHYTSSGSMVWSRTTSAGYAIFNGLHCGNSNELVASARTVSNGLVTIDTVSVNSYASSNDQLIFKFDTSGSVLWAANIPNATMATYQTYPVSMNSSGEVYVAFNSGGAFGLPAYIFAGDTLTNSYGPGIQYCGVFKFSSTGTPLWAKGNTYTNGNSQFFDLMVNSNDEILVCGSYQCAAGFIDNLPLLPSVMSLTSFVVKFDSGGNTLWLKQDYRLANVLYDEAYRLSQGPNNTYYLGGFFADAGGTLYMGCYSNNLSNHGYYYTRISENQEPVPPVDFNVVTEGLTAYFENLLPPPANSSWSFGDAQSSSQVHPSHTYASVGSYNVCLSAVNNCGLGTKCRNVILDGIRDIHADRVANTGYHIIKIYGGFSSNPSLIKLVRSGSPDIIPDTFSLVNSGLLVANLKLIEADTGYYNLVYVSPTYSDTLQAALHVELPDTVLPHVVITGITWQRPNRWGYLKITVNNPTNVSYYGLPLLLTLNPNIETIIANSEISDSSVHAILQQVGTHFYMVRDSLQNDSLLTASFLIAALPAYGSTAVNLYVRTPVSQLNSLHAYIGPSYFSQGDLINMDLRSSCNFLPLCIQCALDLMGFVPAVGCVSAGFNLGCAFGSKPFKGASNSAYLGNIAANLAGTVLSCAGGTQAAEELLEAGSKTILAGALADLGNGIIGAADDCGGDNGCKPGNESNWEWPSTSAIDPNYKAGPRGNTPDNFVNKSDELNYVIHFENVDTATAPAAEVIILDTLDLNAFDLSTFSFTGFGQADSSVSFNIPASSFATEINLQPAKNTMLRISGVLDTLTGIVRWAFLSLDPATYDITSVFSDGFLNPNVTAPEGEGFVSYSVKLKNSVTHLQSFTNTAWIYFDNNAPVATTPFLNTVDTVRPVSSVLPLPAMLSDSIFTVRWTGFDAHAGIKSYDIYMSVNDGPYKKVLALTKIDSIRVSGHMGDKYEFYSIARDHARNIEDAPSNPDVYPDAVTMVVTNIEENNLLSHFSINPNPFNDFIDVIVSSDVSGKTGYELSDITGKIILTGNINAKQGSHHRIETGGLNSGVYFVTINNADGKTFKMVKLK